MKIAIVGSSGYIANFLIKRFEAETSVEKILKIDQTDDADAYLNLLKPANFNYDVLNEIDYVVFTAAISGPDKCASDFDWCWSIFTSTEPISNTIILFLCSNSYL